MESINRTLPTLCTCTFQLPPLSHLIIHATWLSQQHKRGDQKKTYTVGHGLDATPITSWMLESERIEVKWPTDASTRVVPLLAQIQFLPTQPTNALCYKLMPPSADYTSDHSTPINRCAERARGRRRTDEDGCHSSARIDAMGFSNLRPALVMT